MEEIAVTRLWMAGVVAAMAIFGVIALIGHLRQGKQSDTSED